MLPQRLREGGEIEGGDDVLPAGRKDLRIRLGAINFIGGIPKPDIRA